MPSSGLLFAEFLLPIRHLCLLAIALAFSSNCLAAEPIFTDDFEGGFDRWDVLDPKTWKHGSREGSMVVEITARASEYEPPVRSPRHVALIKGRRVGQF